MAKVAFFDMNETTLALEPLDDLFDAWFPTKGIRKMWFQKLLHTTMMSVMIGPRRPFGELASATLHSVGDANGVTLPEGAMAELAATISTLPLHDDVKPGLESLHNAGWRLIALTNSDQAMVEGQLTNAGVSDLFEHIISVESLGTFKPMPDVYVHAAATAGVPTSDGWMIASHDWDLEAAKNVGMKTAFVQRPGNAFSSAYRPPDVAVQNFAGLLGAMGDG